MEMESLVTSLQERLNGKRQAVNTTMRDSSDLTTEATLRPMGRGTHLTEFQSQKQKTDTGKVSSIKEEKQHLHGEALEQKLQKRKEQIRNGILSEYVCFDIPARFKGKSLKNFNDKATANKCLNLIREGKSVFLTGVYGVGKTHLGIALMLEWLADNLRIVKKIQYYDIEPRKGYPFFQSAADLFLELKSSFKNDNTTEEDIINSLDGHNLLMLDDVGVDKVSDWSKQIVYTLIDKRYRNMKPIIITSNLSLEELADTYDARIASRLLEMGEVVTLTGGDKRKQKGGQKR